ncbi:MAG: polysaccharide deacetylase family protein [Bacilli bacterium]
MKRRKNKNIKKIISLILILFLVIIAIVLILVLKNKKDLTTAENIVKEINEHYNEFVKTNKESILYNSKNEEVGKIGNDVELTLNNVQVDKDIKYFSIRDLEGYYIRYQDVDKIEKLSEVSDRYKNYIVFNENIITNDNTSFYDDDDNLVYTLNESFNLPIIIKNDNKYGVEFNNRLLYVKSDDVKEVKISNNTEKKNSSGIAVLNYHAFYDENNVEEKLNCTTSICHSKKQFSEQLELIKEKNMLTLKMKEVEMYIDGKIQLPNSVLITIDDGYKTKVAVDMLTEYKMYATIFLVTSWFDEDEYYKTDYIELHSHTHDMHDGGQCPGGQGGGIKCLPEEEIQKDLKQSREDLNGSTVFCYPFYEYNDYSIKMLKQAGFTMAFIGESTNSDNLVHVGSDKFKLRRFVIVTYTTLSDLTKYFDQIK